MSSGLYNEGLFREGLLRTTNLVRPGLITQFDTLEEALTRFAINGVEAALAIDFIGGEYRTANTSTTFADAFTGTSPKLTYSTTSNSTMVNSSGEIVWAPHNLLPYSEDLTNSWTVTNGTIDDSETGSLATNGAITGAAATTSVGAGYTVAVEIWSETDAGKQVDIGFNTNNLSNTFSAPITLTATPTLYSFSKSNNTATQNSLRIRNADSLAKTIKVRAAHLYRSDLGGMHPVPGAATGFETYVPTNGSAEYLPRVGHHVYNGSTWVNEGLLIESEPRTNLVPYSDFSSGWDETGVDPVALDATGPDGQVNTAVTLNEDSTTGEHKLSEFFAARPASTYTSSVFVKLKPSDTRTKIRLENSNFVATNNYGDFDISAETVTKGSNADNATIEAVGGGWFRCSVTSTSTGVAGAFVTVYLLDASGNTSYTGDGASGVLIYGAQLDQGQVVNGTPTPAPTPSSYMPTYGNQFTRTAQSLTVPPAEFGWPEPEYIGPELVDNHDFATNDLTEWDDISVGTGTVDASSGSAVLSYTDPSNRGRIQQNITHNAGAILSITFTVSGSRDAYLSVMSESYVASAGTHTFTVNPTLSNRAIFVQPAASGSGDLTIDNISVREINPLSVSIQMDGRMTYADEDVGFAGASATSQVVPYDWRLSPTDYIMTGLETDISPHRLWFVSEQNNVPDLVYSEALNSPGVNVPFNIASRHGSTFVNGAVDGTALTANTTPTALPDLSGTNLQIASDFMGTIGTFRQFAGDIGDDGLEEATS